MLYKKLGKLDEGFISVLKSMIMFNKDDSLGYQWIEFDKDINEFFMQDYIGDLKIAYDLKNDKWIQKAFYSPPSSGWKIHKDGIDCKCALNIALQCNETDWVRWYDEDYINELAETRLNTHAAGNKGNSRNVDIEAYEDVEYIDELVVEPGDVYLVNTDVFHSFKCGGPLDRIIVQNKLRFNPSMEEACRVLENKSFKSLLSL